MSSAVPSVPSVPSSPGSAPSTQVTRRAALVAGAAGAGALALAACGTGSGSSSAPSAAANTTLVALDKVTVGQAVSAKLADGSPVVVARPTASTAACFSAICTHQGCTVQPAGAQLQCPCHGSVYNALTGAVISGPAPSPLPAVAVKVDGGNVVTA